MIRKIVIGFLLGIFLAVAAATVLLETRAGARVIQNLVLQELAASGIQVKVREIRGALPEVMELSGLEVQNVAGDTYFIDSLELELSVLRILKKELAFRSVVANGIRREKGVAMSGGSILPLPWRISVEALVVSGIQELPGVRIEGSFSVKQAIKLSLQASASDAGALNLPAQLTGPLTASLSAKGTPDAWRGSANISVNGWDIRAHLAQEPGGAIELYDLIASTQDLRIKGNLQLDAHHAIQNGELQLTATGAQLFATTSLTSQLEGLHVQGRWQLLSEHASGTWDGFWVGGQFVGKTEAKGAYLHEPWTLTSDVEAKLSQEVRLKNGRLNSALFTARGEVVMDPMRLVTGTVDVERADLRLSGVPDLSGTASGQLIFQNAAGRQTVEATGSCHEVLWRGAYAKEIAFHTKLPTQLHVELVEARYKHLKVERATLDANENGPFLLTVDGTLRDQLHVEASGTWRAPEGAALVELQRLSGTAFNHALGLEHATFLSYSPDALSVSGLRLKVGSGLIALEATGAKTASDVSLHVEELPLDIVGFTGALKLDAVASSQNGVTRGTVRLRVPQGTFNAQLDAGRLKAQGELTTGSLNADIPLELALWPPHAHFPLDERADVRLKMQAKVEELLEWVDLGMHHVSGEWTCDLRLKNTLGHPRLEGFCELENGTYENYFTGTSLSGLQANFLADGDHLYLRSLTGQGGKLTASGDIHLSPAKRFPFVFDAEFTELPLAQVDLVTAKAEGKMTLRGTLDAAEASGAVRIVEADFTIPDKIPEPLPELQVVYKHGVIPVTPPVVDPHPYPLHLNLDVSAPGNVFVRGRGLSSEWKGDFHVGGTYTSIAAKGTLELLFGEFVFSGRTFTLTEGVLTFGGESGEMPSLNLAGHMTERGVAITARVRGPLNKPQITFQSVPPLPFSSIMSYLLFGKDISEIDGFQAIQLAGSVATLSGQSSDVLEGTRRSLGIDRLRIVSTGSSEDGETVAIQVGKYVAKGVIVSFSQGADESSTNVSIEVDLKHGFVFQAESDQTEEQGKFTIKWNRNY